LSLLSVDSAVWRSCDVSSEATLMRLIDSMEVRNVTVAAVTSVDSAVWRSAMYLPKLVVRLVG
jgi:hypothetical protein